MRNSSRPSRDISAQLHQGIGGSRKFLNYAVFENTKSFAATNNQPKFGPLPIEVSSGPRTIHRLSRRGNRRINYAIHMAAVTQIRHRHSDGRDCYERKLAAGKTPKEALRCLKRRVSDAIFARLRADARRQATATSAGGPGGQPGNGSIASAAGSHPEHRLFGQATPGPDATLRSPSRRSHTRQAPAPKKTRKGS
ncbi:MAG: transposase [Actinomycetota bacterium]